jgi:hypothetical protein
MVGGMGMEMMSDPKMRTKMLKLRAKMMKEMGEIIEARAKEIEGSYIVDSSIISIVRKYNTPLTPSSGEPGAGDTTADLIIGGTPGTPAATPRRSASAFR